MAYNYSKLIGRIVEKFGSRSAFAKEVGMSEHALSRKLNNKAKLSQDEIGLFCEHLDIRPLDMHSYFFTKVSQ